MSLIAMLFAMGSRVNFPIGVSQTASTIRDPPVQVRFGDTVVRLICTGYGNIEFESERQTGGLIYGATFDLSDPEYLIVEPSNKKRWRARRERLTDYFEPPDDWLSGVIASADEGSDESEGRVETDDVKP